jgi:hypothetical protein
MTVQQLHETPTAANGTDPGRLADRPPDPAHATGEPPHAEAPVEHHVPTVAVAVGAVAAGAVAGAAGGFVAGRRTAPSPPARQLRRWRRHALVGAAKRAPKVTVWSARKSPKATWWAVKNAPRAAFTTRRTLRRLNPTT